MFKQLKQFICFITGAHDWTSKMIREERFPEDERPIEVRYAEYSRTTCSICGIFNEDRN